VRNCTKDEGRPIGAGLQEQASNHLKLRWYRGVIKDHEAFWAWGRGGQLISIFPKLDLVAVFTSNPYDNYKRLFRPFRMLKKYILPAMLTK